MTVSDKIVQRLLLERDLMDSREIVYEAPDGVEIVFSIRTLTTDEKTALRKYYDTSFPVPPVVTTNLGLARFNVTDETYQARLSEWSLSLSRGVLAETIGLSEQDIEALEGMFPPVFVQHLFSTIELINGVQSDPLADLIREAMWAPEVLTFAERHQPAEGGVKITETPLFREIDCMIAAGLKLRDWELLSPREKMTYMNWRDYSQAKEAYVQDSYDKKNNVKTRRGL